MGIPCAGTDALLYLINSARVAQDGDYTSSEWGATGGD